MHPQGHLDIRVLNTVDPSEAAALLRPFVERAPEIADRIADRRPFRTPSAIADAVAAELEALSVDRLIELFRRHPELAPAAPEAMTPESQSEQGQLGLARPEPALARRLADLNARYSARFGFPFIVALHAFGDTGAVLAAFEARLDRAPDEEIVAARREIASVSRRRIMAAFGVAGEEAA